MPQPGRKREFPPQPSSEEQQRLGKLLLFYLGTKKSTRRRPVMEFLFSELARMGDNPEVIKAIHVIEGTGGTVTPASESSMRAMLSRLNDSCDQFFNEWEEGRQERWRVYFEHGDYLPRFRVNEPPTQEIDFVKNFWLPYIKSMNPTRLLYPEPQFFIDQHDTYLRNPKANHPDGKQHFRYFPSWKELKPSYSFVASGIVVAILGIMECFRRLNQRIVAEPIRPHDFLPETHDNLIVLGTPTSTALITILESPLAIRTHARQITLSGQQHFEDIDPEYTESDALEFVKWGTLTRRCHRFADRFVTVLSGTHGRTVAAMAQLLTNPLEIPALVENLDSPENFPECFQALFRVGMIQSDTGPRIDNIHVERLLVQKNP